MSDMALRTRSTKVRFWVNPKVLQEFTSVNNKLGYSRDGGLEWALVDFIAKHKGDSNVSDRL
jgi:hypothetical protein